VRNDRFVNDAQLDELLQTAFPQSIWTVVIDSFVSRRTG
jgi:hypothetical protein